MSSRVHTHIIIIICSIIRVQHVVHIRFHYTTHKKCKHESINVAESIRTSRRYNAARTFLERSSISKAFNFLNGRGIPTSEIIFLSPTRISKVPLRGRVEGSPRTQGYIDLGFVSILTFFLPAFTSFSILLARLLNAPQLLHASITTSNPESSFCDNETCE